MFSVYITHHSKIRELSDRNKTENISKQTIQPWDPHILSYGWWKHKNQTTPYLSLSLFLFHSFSLVSFRPCLVTEFKQWKLLFKHHNMYFHTFFHSRIFLQNLNNITINLLPNGPLVSWPSSVSHLCLSLNLFTNHNLS